MLEILEPIVAGLVGLAEGVGDFVGGVADTCSGIDVPSFGDVVDGADVASGVGEIVGHVVGSVGFPDAENRSSDDGT